MKLLGIIRKGLSYQFVNRERVEETSLTPETINSNIRAFISKIDDYKVAVCKWVSPKRTRSYPYARVYDILAQDTSKKAVVIPVIKDEGSFGDRDFLQWDTISLLSLLGVYFVPAYYCSAERKLLKGKPKLTNQRFDTEYVIRKLRELVHYKGDALHWNLEEIGNMEHVIEQALRCYREISKSLKVPIHDEKGIEEYLNRLKKSLEEFKEYSRKKAQEAQTRETKTIQPKEAVNVGYKMPIDIENYLGGVYHFTVDEVEITEGKVRLIESKHTNRQLLPNIDDVKDGLVKVMLYRSIDELYYMGIRKDFEVVLRLTSSSMRNLNLFDIIMKLRGKPKVFYTNLLQEAKLNCFKVE
jgi:hypothetical protein